MKKARKWALLSTAVVLLTALCFGAYTGRAYAASTPLENVKAGFPYESRVQADTFRQADAFPYRENKKGSFMTYIAADGAKDAAEMFLIHHQPYLSTSLSRCVVDAHYTADTPVGFVCTVLENGDGEETPTGFLFSANQLGIARIDYRLRDWQTGRLVEESYACSLEPFARAFVLPSGNMELESMVCYDMEGGVVYTVGV